MFSAFPEALPGVGLLLLRGAVAALWLTLDAQLLEDWNHLAAFARFSALFTAGSVILLLAGYLTPFASAGVGIGCLAATLKFLWPPLTESCLLDSNVVFAFVEVVTVSVICLGPGAFSVDARLFGRREIVIDGRSGSSSIS